MITQKGLRWSGKGISNGRQRLLAYQGAARCYSISALRKPALAGPTFKDTRGTQRIHQVSQSRSLSLFGWATSSKPSSDEFAAVHSSPQPTPPSQNVIETWDFKTGRPVNIKASHATSDAPDPSLSQPAAPIQTPEANVLSDIQNAVASPNLSPDTLANSTSEFIDVTAAEHLGYLKDTCGLDYGWGPTAFQEFILEHIHILGGLSWSLSIVSLAFLTRGVIFRYSAHAADSAAGMKSATPIMKPMRDKYLVAAKNKDTRGMMELRAQMKAVNEDYGVKMSRVFMPILIQIPLQFGAFRLLRGMTFLPVPAFETENWLWTTNLCYGDPYFILPVLSSGFLYLTMRLQIQNSTVPGGSMGDLQKWLRIILPLVNLGFMAVQTGAVQLYFISTTALACAQAVLISTSGTRKWLGIRPVPTEDAPKKSGVIGGMRIGTPKVIEVKAKVEQSPVERSLLDKIVDKAKGHKDSLRSSFKSVGESAAGTSQDRRKKALQAKADEYEAKRKRDLEIERESRNRRQGAVGGRK